MEGESSGILQSVFVFVCVFVCLGVSVLYLLSSQKANTNNNANNNNPNFHTTITQLNVYPVKSCRGVSLKSTTLTKTGLKYDRRWMFVNAKNNFLTIREKAEMTLIQTAFDDSTDELVISFPVGGGGDSTTTGEAAPVSRREVRVPLEPSPAWLAANAEKATVTIFGAGAAAYVFTEPNMKRVFADFFDGKEVRLVMKDTAVPRVCLDNGAPQVMGRVVSVGFPDVLPVLIASETSLEELNVRLVERGQPRVTFERFRPNIVVAGGDPWCEDEWKTVRVNGGRSADSWLSRLTAGYLGANAGALDIDVAAHCPRCQVPNVNPVTAAKSKHEPWDTLMKYRRIDQGEKYKPCVGMLSCPRNEGRIEVGMTLDVLATTKDHKYLKIR